MKIVIVGAGSVGRAIATDLLDSDSILNADIDVVLIDDDPQAIKASLVPGAEWVLGDACSPSVLEEVGVRECDALVAVTGDDKVNLVVSLLAKTVFGTPKVIARANQSTNEWMFNSNWGVDVIASTPKALSSLVSEVVSVGQAVKLMAMDQSNTSIYTIELPRNTALAGLSPKAIDWPAGLIVSAIIVDGEPVAIEDCELLDSGNELIVVTARNMGPALAELEALVSPSI